MVKNILTMQIGRYQEEKLDIQLSAFEVFKRLYSSCCDLFLLESLGEEGRYNRYSYVGFSPAYLISALGGELIINNQLFKTENPYRFLAEKFSLLQSDGNGFCGGLVGYVSYEGTKYFESAFSGLTNSEFPDFQFGFYEDGLKFDKKGNFVSYFHHGKSRKKEVENLINRSGRLETFKYKVIPSVFGKEKHREMVRDVQKNIKVGNIFQAVLSLKKHYQVDGDKRRIYAILRSINPSPYMVYMKFGQREIICASPELLIRVKGKDIEHFGTLAGTIGRGNDLKEDDLLAQKLVTNEKEMAEHMMLVDLARNDIGKICQFGSVRVDRLHTVKKFSHVQHLYSEVRGKLTEGENCFSALSSCFPAGTLSGAPKIEAMKLISKLESEPRGPYGGVAGYFSLNSEAMLAIIIRSLFINGNHAYTQTGSGIVLDSKAESEYQEIINKQKAIEEALRLAAVSGKLL
ncbi:anthranilate synthase component I family protein [Patescibacteria group bacterium]|nr:anthranilate synthase component I family protein [Patescibacteria group bacterium]MCL5797215.1 anthranilate synthase component I family protein [Patescibacteria group bacterium]